MLAAACVLAAVVLLHPGLLGAQDAALATQGVADAAATDAPVWWFWPAMLFGMTFVMGILAAVGGVGGGVLFVPIVSGFWPWPQARAS
jgi:hypothetical protein